ncbi:MAG: glycosyltransferase [Ignavibacteria bacterium]|jgi:glycosyltransferase involved in cell wall biosynthesis|nr:glycosyltransferase [Ignavibacteria bacterium]MCU7504423.1 glycosyltransferase [Ignavibacteria bacterium]MCU7517486.1 glycosyltransferase [Ignavibacteria bacterium]
MPKASLLIIGKTPPPLGGVAVHIQRLLFNLRRDNIPFESVSLSLPGLRTFIYKYFRAGVVHLNTSNVYARMALTLLSFLTKKKHINTYHGNLGNKGGLKNLADRISISLATRPVVLNEDARSFALRYNEKTVKISAFIPPPFEEALSEEIKHKISVLRSSYGIIYSTNAYGLMYDAGKNEIYGIMSLIGLFSQLCDRALILSDPGASYKKYLEKNGIKLTPNVLMISEAHSFFEILKLSDCYLRNTSTDGDSISIKEALYLGKAVIATDCVQRPRGVTLCKTNDPLDLLERVKKMDAKGNSYVSYPVRDGYMDLRKIYQELTK